MFRKLRTQFALQAIVLGAVGFSVLAPPSFVFYRCEMSGTLMSAPCGDDEKQSASNSPQLLDESCCARIDLAVERAPAELSPTGTELAPPPALPPVALAVIDAPFDRIPESARLAPRDAGPPIFLRSCSLLN